MGEYIQLNDVGGSLFGIEGGLPTSRDGHILFSHLLDLSGGTGLARVAQSQPSTTYNVGEDLLLNIAWLRPLHAVPVGHIVLAAWHAHAHHVVVLLHLSDVLGRVPAVLLQKAGEWPH